MWSEEEDAPEICAEPQRLDVHVVQVAHHVKGHGVEAPVLQVAQVLEHPRFGKVLQ